MVGQPELMVQARKVEDFGDLKVKAAEQQARR
jgi:hypothetical protein